MSELDELLGIDPDDPEQALANELVQQDKRFLDALVQYRRDRMSQQQMADLLGITQPAVQQFERRDGNPRMSTLRRYALALGVLVTHHVTDAKRRDPIDKLREMHLVTDWWLTTSLEDAELDWRAGSWNTALSDKVLRDSQHKRRGSAKMNVSGRAQHVSVTKVSGQKH